jgi:hypothetical protein
MTNPYEDILSHPYPFPTQRKRMSLADRAAQFAPFAALRGFSDSITTAASHSKESSYQKKPNADANSFASGNCVIRK